MTSADLILLTYIDLLLTSIDLFPIYLDILLISGDLF
jgi:hypothetical protein